MNGKYANASETTRNRMEMKVIRSVITMAMKPDSPVFIVRFPFNVYSFRLHGYPRKHKGALIAKCVRNGKSIIISAGAIGYDGKYICMIFGYFCDFSLVSKLKVRYVFVKRDGNEWGFSEMKESHRTKPGVKQREGKL